MQVVNTLILALGSGFATLRVKEEFVLGLALLPGFALPFISAIFTDSGPLFGLGSRESIVREGVSILRVDWLKAGLGWIWDTSILVIVILVYTTIASNDMLLPIR